MSAECVEDGGVDVVDGDPDDDDYHIFSDGFGEGVLRADEHRHVGRRQIHLCTHRAAGGKTEELLWKSLSTA